MSFNKWKDEYGLEFEPNYSKETELDCKAAFKAGQQSRQAETDLLQKRIDEIDNHVGVNYDCERDDDQHSYWSGYNQALREIFEMLKGCTNE